MLSIDDVAPTWVDASVLSPKEDQVVIEVFWRLLHGSPVLVDDLCASLGLSRETMEEVVAGLEAKGCLRRTRLGGAVVAARGLMTHSSPHRLTTERGRIYTQCAVDAIGIPAALGLEAVIEDHCAHCDRQIRATVSQAREISVDPGAAVIVMAQGECCAEEAIPRMCQETNLFCSREHAATWQHEYATLPGAIVTLEDALALGRVLWNRFARTARLSRAALDSCCYPFSFERGETGPDQLVKGETSP
jgi:hypothetical protein